MKNKLRLVILSIACIVGACLAEQNNPLTIPTCTDGIKNQNEEAIDCGGVCVACVKPFSVPCKDSLVDNRITLDVTNYSYTSSDLTCYSNYAGNYQLTFFAGDYEMDIEIYGSLPTKNTVYDLLNPSADGLSEGFASISMSNFYTYDTYYSTTGKLYVTYTNGKWDIEVCSIYLSGYYGKHKFRGSLICG